MSRQNQLLQKAGLPLLNQSGLAPIVRGRRGAAAVVAATEAIIMICGPCEHGATIASALFSITEVGGQCVERGVIKNLLLDKFGYISKGLADKFQIAADQVTIAYPLVVCRRLTHRCFR